MHGTTVKNIGRYCNGLRKHVVEVVAVVAAVAVAGCCSYRKGKQPVTKLIVNDFKLVLQARNTVCVCVCKVSYCAQSAQAVTTPSVHIWRHFIADRGCLS
jgi:hypothetical protein